MRNQAKTIIFTLAVLLGFILSGISISLLFENWFIDATPQHRYTLSQASRHLAANLSQPLNVRLYYSPKIADNYPETAQYFNDIYNLLYNYAEASNGKLTLQVIYLDNPETIAKEASKNGLKPFLSKDGKEHLYLGAVVRNEQGDSIKIPHFLSGRRLQLESDLNRIFTRLSTNEKATKIGILAPDMSLGQTFRGYMLNGGDWNIFKPIADEYAPQIIPGSAVQIGNDINTVIVVNPTGGLSKLNLYALDQFLLRGGNLIILADSFNEHLNSANNTAVLNQLLSQANLQIGADQVIGDLNNAEPAIINSFVAEYHPAINLGDKYFNQEHQLSQTIHRLSLRAPAPILISEQFADVSTTVLAHTSDESLSIPLKQYKRFQPSTQADYIKHEQYPLITLAEGLFTSSFENNILSDKKMSEKMLPFLPESLKPGRILLISDVDFLYNDTWSDSRFASDNPLYGVIPNTDNAAFLLRALDYFSGRDAYLNYTPQPPMAPSVLANVFASRNHDKFGATREQIIQALTENQNRLTALQKQSQVQALSYAELKQLEELSSLVNKGHQDLRQIGYQIEHDRQSQARRFILLNIFAMGLIMFGIIYLFRRHQRKNTFSA